DHLSTPHARAVRYCDPAHVRVAGGKPPSMREPHVIAMPAVASGKLPRAVADSIDRGAVAGLHREARVRPPTAYSPVPATPVAGGDTARNRSHQALALLGDAGGFVELAILAPAEHLLARLPVAQDCGIDELAGLDLTGRRALVFNHQVELVGAGNPPVEVDFAAERAQVLLHGAGGSSGSAGRAVKTGSDDAADAERRGVHLDRPRIEHQPPGLVALDRKLQIETSAERQRLERAVSFGCRAAPEGDVELRTRRDLRQRHFVSHQRGDEIGFRRAYPGALEHAVEP